MVVHFILDMLIYVLLCVVYSFCPLEKFVRVASKTRDLMLWCAAVTAEKDECAGIANMELGMREIDKLICDYTHMLVFQYWFSLNSSNFEDFKYFPSCWLSLIDICPPFFFAIKWLIFRTWRYQMHI